MACGRAHEPGRQGRTGDLSLAALSNWAHGAFLLAVYSAGLGIPFLLTALAFSHLTTAFTAVKRHYAAIMGSGSTPSV